MSETIPLYQVKPKQVCTDPLYRFIAEYHDIIDLFFFVVTSATTIDRMRNIASKALAKVDAQKEEHKAERHDAFTQVRTFGPPLSKNLVMTMVNNFSCYLSEVIQLVVRKKYEVLRSSERLATDEILQFSRLSDLIAYIADKKINELSYGGLQELERFLSDRLGLSLFASEDERILLTIFVEIRNVHTHNRGVINELFLKRLGTKTYQNWKFVAGKEHHVDFDEFVALANNSIDIAIRLDELIAKKFKLRRFNFQQRFMKDRKTRYDKIAALPISDDLDSEKSAKK
jgi:hypothetical protein